MLNFQDTINKVAEQQMRWIELAVEQSQQFIEQQRKMFDMAVAQSERVRELAAEQVKLYENLLTAKK